MKLIIFLVLLVLSTSTKEIDEFDNAITGESWILDLVDKLGKRFYELKMDTSEPGKSILGYEKELGLIWQNFLTWSACIVGTEVFVHGANLLNPKTPKPREMYYHWNCYKNVIIF